MTPIFCLLLAVIKFMANAEDCKLYKIDSSGNPEDNSYYFMASERNESSLNPGEPFITLEGVNIQQVSIDSTYLEISNIPKSVTPSNIISEVNIQLNTNFTDYRMDVWKPNIEAHIFVKCNETTELTYTYIVVIMDENRWAPEITPTEIKLNASIPYDSNKTINHPGEIKILDYDFNEAHALKNIQCNGDDCKFIRLNYVQTESEKFYSYMVNISLIDENDTVWDELIEKSELNFELVAEDDSLKSEGSAVKVSIQIQSLNDPKDKDSSNWATLLYVLVGVMGLIAVLLAAVYMKWRHMGQQEKISQTEIDVFYNGGKVLTSVRGRNSIEETIPVLALPYNRTYEIPRDRLKVDETKELGNGAYGMVLKGRVLYKNGTSQEVAIKTVKKSVRRMYFKALLSEMKIMANLGEHKNVIRLIATCIEDIRKSKAWLAVEYCRHGSLYKYLQAGRLKFQNFVIDSQYRVPEILNRNPMYEIMRQSSLIESSAVNISTKDLLSWAIQIASGLEFIASKNIVHGDLAARNILLTEDNVVKIADFGLSRRMVDIHTVIRQDQNINRSSITMRYTLKSNKEKLVLPWRWLAIETLQNQGFSLKSDIWAFGVVLWELFTLAETPFADMERGPMFIASLRAGMRLRQPFYAPDKIYELMTACWRNEPSERPTISELKTSLINITKKALDKTDGGYLTLEDPSVCSLSNYEGSQVSSSKSELTE